MARSYDAIELARRPQGPVQAADFRLVQRELRDLAPGEVLVRNQWLSLDPYMRGRMSDAKSYAPPAKLDEVMVGGTAGVVEASTHAGFSPGDAVAGLLGWQEYAISDGTALTKVGGDLPPQAFLGAAGMPGITAWYGVTHICKPANGETFLVSAAAGAVGGVAGQLAKRAGARVIGIAGGKDKCAYVKDELGFDACIDYKAADADLAAALLSAAPDGVDSYFDNVGGDMLNAALKVMNREGRLALCGMIAGYDGQPVPIHNPWLLLSQRLSTRGFIISDHPQLWAEARAHLVGLVRSGELRLRESISEGLASAPAAFIGLLRGRNMGKQLVRL